MSSISAPPLDGTILSTPHRPRWQKHVARAALLTAPYFYIRMHGFDFSKGTSLSLVDTFLFVLLGVLIIEDRGHLIKKIRENRLALIGTIFFFWSIIAAIFRETLSQLEPPIKWSATLSAATQYGFVLTALPLVVARFFRGSVSRVIFWIGLGYLPPLIISILFARHGAFDTYREYFYSSHRAIGTYGNANSFAFVLLLVIPYYTYLATRTREEKWLGFAGQTLSVVALALTASFSGILVFALMMILIAGLIMIPNRLVKIQRWSAIKFCAVSVALIIVAGFLTLKYAPNLEYELGPRYSGAVVDKIESVGIQDFGSASQRLTLMEKALRKLQNGTILWGLGLGNCRFNPSFSFGGIQLDVHNVYLLLALEGGLALAGIFMIYLFTAFKGTRRKQVSPESYAAMFCIIALALYGLNFPHIYLRYFWIPLIPVFMMAEQQHENIK